jgi:hypothetical protein
LKDAGSAPQLMKGLPPEEKHTQVPSVEQVEYRVVWEDECDTTPPCVDLLADPENVLENKERWPRHLCYAAFQRRSTELWAGKSVGVVTQTSTTRWMGLHPLPIGRKAVIAEEFLGGPKEKDELNGVEELFNIVPFEGYEETIWALRIEHKQATAVHTLDLFGLIEYPTEEHRTSGTGVAGGLQVVLRGRDRALIDLLFNAERWWAQFRGLTFRGRPKGTGRWANREHFEREVRQVVTAMRSSGEKVTQEEVALRLNTGDRQLRERLRYFGIKWSEIINE